MGNRHPGYDTPAPDQRGKCPVRGCPYGRGHIPGHHTIVGAVAHPERPNADVERALRGVDLKIIRYQDDHDD